MLLSQYVENGSVQLLILCYINLLSTIYVTLSDFSLYRKIRRRDYFNDLIFSMQTYGAIYFTDMAESVEQRTYAGYVVLTLAILVFTVNAAIYIAFVLKWFYLLCKKIYNRLKYRINLLWRKFNIRYLVQKEKE